MAESRRDEVLARIRVACQEGAQAYWVCPLIEESETLQLKTAVETFDMLTASLPDVKVGLVHGRMKPVEKNEVMTKFVANEINPFTAEWEKAGIFPAHALFKKMGDLGLLGIKYPTVRDDQRAAIKDKEATASKVGGGK